MAGIQILALGTTILLFTCQDVIGNTTPYPLPPEVIDGPGEGNEGDDILLLPEQMEMMQSDRKAISSTAYRWTESGGFPTVPYRFADNLVDQLAVTAAVAHWEEHTCLIFPLVDDTFSGSHLFFQRHASSCNSYIGMVFADGQPINVPEWCEKSFGSLVHEIGHAIGFFHEQSRSDRNDYVKINTNNIISTSLRNFDLASDNNYSVPYDFNSDMHYNEKGFTSNGQITIATLNPLYQGVIGQRTGLSHMDKLLANKMYNCISKILATCSLITDPCQNYGYMGKNCSCVCPDGTSGTNCETLNKGYNDVNLSAFTETITSPGTVTSPNYPSTTPPGEKYTKLIQAPIGKLIQLTFSDFNTYSSASSCNSEGLEIRTTDMFDGTWYCGNEITPGQIFNSTTNQMILFFKAIGGYSPAKWSANIAFVDDPSCNNDSTTTTTSSAPSISTSSPIMPPTTTSVTPPTPTMSTPPATTSTTTSSITTTITTTKPDAPPCGFVDYGNGLKGFYSPRFPWSYPNNAICVHENNNKMPFLAILFFIRFKLSRGDKLVIEHPYGPSHILRGSKKRMFIKRVPSYFRATFTSDGASTKQGFLVKYLQIQGKYYRSLNGTTPGSVTTPGYPFKHWKSTVCEWKITVSPGKRILLAIRIRKVTCNKNYLAIDKTPYDTYSYDAGAIDTYCGKMKTVYVTSDTNVITVFYFGFKKDRGVKVTYSEIP